MRFVICSLKVLLISLVFSSSCFATNQWGDYKIGISEQTNLHITAVIVTEEGEYRDVYTLFKFGGIATTSSGDTVVWGYFYADPNGVSWGNPNNPDLYVKIWLDHTGRIDVNYFHVSVPYITVVTTFTGLVKTTDSALAVSRTSMNNRYVRHTSYPGRGGFYEE